MRTRTYYDAPDAMVTNDQFVWHTASGRLVFQVQHLRNVGRVQAPARVRPFAPALAGCTLFAAVAGWTLLADPALYVVAFLALATPAVAATWRQPRHWELHAQHRGEAVVLFSSADERVFNQVSRALRRAMEDARGTPFRVPQAAV
jgi:hypothetical protein